ncbi:MAG: hypothetical protein ACTS11_14910, partial [Roseicyclus sp.]
FPAGTGDGHHMINRSDRDAVCLEIGSRHPDDLTTCSDVDMMSANADGRLSARTAPPAAESDRARRGMALAGAR